MPFCTSFVACGAAVAEADVVVAVAATLSSEGAAPMVGAAPSGAVTEPPNLYKIKYGCPR